MNRREMLKLGAAIAVAPSVPVAVTEGAIPADWVRVKMPEWRPTVMHWVAPLKTYVFKLNGKTGMWEDV